MNKNISKKGFAGFIKQTKRLVLTKIPRDFTNYSSAETQALFALLLVAQFKSLDAIGLLFNSDDISNAITIIRTEYERLLNMKYIVVKDRDIRTRLYTGYFSFKIKTFLQKNNPELFDEIKSSIAFYEELREKHIPQKGSKPYEVFGISKKAMAREAGMANIHEIAYPFLCDYSHNEFTTHLGYVDFSKETMEIKNSNKWKESYISDRKKAYEYAINFFIETIKVANSQLKFINDSTIKQIQETADKIVDVWETIE